MVRRYARERATRRRSALRTAVPATAVAALALALLLHSVVFASYVVNGVSMEPTLTNGERILALKLGVHWLRPKTGWIIVFRSPLIPTEDWVKRIIAVPGETIAVKNNVVYLDGRRYREPFLRYRQSENVGPLRVPPGYLWVEGDNRPESNDSRYFGLLPMRDVIARVVLVWWPPSRLRWLS